MLYDNADNAEIPRACTQQDSAFHMAVATRRLREKHLSSSREESGRLKRRSSTSGSTQKGFPCLHEGRNIQGRKKDIVGTSKLVLFETVFDFKFDLTCNTSQETLLKTYAN